MPTMKETLRQAAIAEAERTSMYALAKKSGMDYSTVQRFIRGERDLTLSVAEPLAISLGFTLKRTRRTRKEGTG